MMHGNNFNSLNFQHGGYQDPFADLQQSLGAGGIFSQTLKQMNQDMYANAQRDRADEEFKWRKDDRQRQEDERNNAIGLYKAMNDRQLQADAGNQMFKAIGENGKADYYTDAKDSAMGGTVSANSNSIMDLRAKLADPKFANNSEAKRILGVINGEGGFDKQFSGDYANASKIGMLNDAYKLLGQDDATAQKSAAAALGTNLGNVSGVQKATDMQNKFIGDMEAARTTDPMLSQSTASVVRDYIAAHPEAQNDLNIMKTSNDMFKAEEVARAQQKQAIQEARDKAIQAGQNEQAKNLELRLKLIDSQSNISKAQMNAAFGGSNGYSNYAVDPVTGTVASGATGSGKDYNSEFAKAKASTLSKLFGVAGTNEKNKDVVAAVSRYADELQAKGLNPDSLETYLRMSISSKNPEKGEDRIYTFNNSNSMAAPKATDIIDASTYGVKGKNAKDPELAIMLRDLAVNGEKSKIDEITKALNAGNMTVANAKANLANLERTPYQAMAAEAKEFELGRLRDRGEIAMPSMALQTDNFDKVGKGNGSSGDTMSGSQSQNLATGNRLFDGAKNIMGMGEGTAFNVYNDTMIVNGVKKDRPATAYGTSIDDINATIKDKSLWISPNQKMLTPVQQEYAKKVIDARIQQDLADASKYTKKYGIESEALNIGLANMIHQYGSGSKIVASLANDIASSVAKNDYQGAVNKVLRSSYASAYPDRAAAMVQLLAHEAPNSSAINTGNTMKYGSAKAAADYYNNSYKALKAKGYSDDDIATTMSMLQRGFANQNILGINYGSANNPLGMSGVSQGLQRSIVANETPLPTTGLSPNDIMLDRLRFQNGNVKMSANDFKDPDYAKGLREDVLNTQANNAAADFKYYSNQNLEQQKLYNQHLEDDGKLPSQIDLVWKAGLQKQYQEANSPKARLKAIADAQRKLANGNVALSNDPLKNLVNNRY